MFQYNGIQTSPLFSQVCIHPQICSEEKFNALEGSKRGRRLVKLRETNDVRPVVGVLKLSLSISLSLARALSLSLALHFNQSFLLLLTNRTIRYHGTAPDVIPKISQQGFNRAYCGKNAVRYGKGVYFALTSGYSNAYAGANPKKMFVCRVMAGETSQGYNEQLVPEVRVQATNVMFDSTTDRLQAPEPIQTGDPAARSNVRQMYVVYHDAQAYPEYLIEVRISFLLFMIRHGLFVCSFNHCPFHPSTRIKDEHLFV